VILGRSLNTEPPFAFKSWTKFVWRFVRNSSAAVHDLMHITVACKTRKIIENTHRRVHDLRAARQLHRKCGRSDLSRHSGSNGTENSLKVRDAMSVSPSFLLPQFLARCRAVLSRNSPRMQFNLRSTRRPVSATSDVTQDTLTAQIADSL